MKNLKIISLILLIFNYIRVFAVVDTLERILITDVEFGHNVANLNIIKVEAALDLAARLSRKFQIIPIDIRDSVAKELKRKNIEPTPYNLGKELAASKLLIIRINRLANILRVDLSCFDTKDNSISDGKGYAAIRYFIKEKNEPVLDPALLAAFQRALADLIHEPNLYQNLSGSFKVKPAPPLVIGTINYIENDTLNRWDIFRKKQVTSYFALETIFETAHKTNDFVVLDIPTRDSIFSFFQLYEPENFSPPTSAEIKALLDFEIEYYIAGELFWGNGNANLRLFLCKITEEGLKIEKEVLKVISEDSLDSYKNAITSATIDLLNIPKE